MAGHIHLALTNEELISSVLSLQTPACRVIWTHQSKLLRKVRLTTECIRVCLKHMLPRSLELTFQICSLHRAQTPGRWHGVRKVHPACGREHLGLLWLRDGGNTDLVPDSLHSPYLQLPPIPKPRRFQMLEVSWFWSLCPEGSKERQSTFCRTQSHRHGLKQCKKQMGLASVGVKMPPLFIIMALFFSIGEVWNAE